MPVINYYRECIVVTYILTTLNKYRSPVKSLVIMVPRNIISDVPNILLNIQLML